MARRANIQRKTKETEIKLELELDGEGKHQITVGIPFFEHMLSQLIFHSGCDLELEGKGDIEVDFHHLVEDVGICLGQALNKALGDKKGILRFGSACVPLDEALVLSSIDISGRGFCGFEICFPHEKIGDFDTALFSQFFHAFANNAEITLHLRQLSGENSHHIAEAGFKACARALREAVSLQGKELPSTKGRL